MRFGIHVPKRPTLSSTMGHAAEIGITPEELARIVEPFPPNRVGVLLDTAHLWAMGYDLRKESEVDRVVRECDETVGLDRLRAIHANDSLK